MTEQLERELRELFAADAERAPCAGPLVEMVVRRVRRRRRTQLAWGAGSLAVAVAAVAVLAGGLAGSGHQGRAARTPVASTSLGVSRLGALPGSGTASCVEPYNLATVAKRSFAFDGTVTTIGPARTNLPGAELPLAAVTFKVHEWFRGGSGSSVTLDMTPPQPGSGQAVTESAPSYGVGTRLLVSGEPRWGGAPLTDAIAWGCGFTRYYDPATAGAWRNAMPAR
jgi:hypothetical protein